MALENKLMLDAQGRHIMNDFQRTVWIAEQVTDQVQRVLIAIKNGGYRLPNLVSISVDGIVGHLTDDPVIKKAIVKRARKAGLKMADVEVSPNATPEQVQAAENKALEKLDAQEDKIDVEVEKAAAQLDNDLEAMLIAEKPETRLSKQERRRKAMAAEHLDAKVVIEAATRLGKSAKPEDRAAAKNAMELLMGPPMDSVPMTKEEMREELAIPTPSPAHDYFVQVNERDEAIAKEKADEALKAEKKASGEKKPEAPGAQP